MRTTAKKYRFLALVLCLCILQTLFCDFSERFSVSYTVAAAGESNGPTRGVVRQADPSTMDTYDKELDMSKNTRYAGQVWTDKSVFAYGASDTGDRAALWKSNTLQLTKDLDGVEGSVSLNDDFLHVFSALGTSLEVTGVPPVRTVIVFDNSGSMYNSNTSGTWKDQRVALTLEAINRAIDALMEASIYNEVAVVLFGDGERGGYSDDANNFIYDGHSAAVTILPMKRYEVNKTAGDDTTGKYTPYLTGGWTNVCDGEHPIQTGTPQSGGWVYVNNDLCGLTAEKADTLDKWKDTGFNGCGNKKFSAYRNGTTDIQAGFYQGMQELLDAVSVIEVGGERYQCVPSLVMLTDGSATDMMNGTFMEPGEIMEARGFVNDTGNRLRSFTGATGSDVKEIGNFWDMLVEREGDLYASISWHAGLNNSSPKTPDAASTEKLKQTAETYSDSVASMLLGTLMTTAYYKAAVKKAYHMADDENWGIYTISVDMIDPHTIPNNAAQNAKLYGNSDEDGKYVTGGNPEPKDQLPKSWYYDISSNPFTIDPSEFFYKDGKLDLSWLKQKGYIDADTEIDLTNPDPALIPYHTAYPDYSVGEMIIQGVVKAAAYLKEWETGKAFTTKYQSWSSVTNLFRTKKDEKLTGSAKEFCDKYVNGKYINPWTHSNGYLFEPVETITWPQVDGNLFGVTTADVIDNIDYNDEAYYAFTKRGDAGSLAQVFVTILDGIMKPLFQPAKGDNDLNVTDAVTYMDPLGKYMDVKDVKQLALFGTIYDITRTAVYNYEWNNIYKVNSGDPNTPLRDGWYKGDPVEGMGAAGNSSVDYCNGTLPPGCENADDAWEQGWVYRLGVTNASKFVPSLKDISNPALMSEKQRHTTYTFYRVAKSDEERRTLQMNPAYGTALPEGVVYGEDGEYRKKAGVYALEDLRIWVEDSGGYNDPDVETGGVMTDANFDEALWLNIPINMLPVRTVTVNLGHSKGSATSWEYSTNMDPDSPGHIATYPMRLFYTVGITESMIKPENRHVNIAGTVEQEYIQKYKITSQLAATAHGISQGYMEFFSNWYNPENRYAAYASTSTDYTYGDPVVSFSPNTENRYYIFRKPLPLYNRAYIWVPTTEKPGDDPDYTKDEGTWKRVVLQEDYTGSDAMIIDPNEFEGRLVLQDLEPENDQETHESRQSSMWNALEHHGVTKVKKGDIILLAEYRMDDVTYVEGKDDPVPSDQYFYIAIDYYVLDGEGTAGVEKYVVARKGSEFGSAYEAQGISNGDMLCWHDISEHYEDNYPYLSRSDTGDPTRGKQYIGTKLDEKTKWYEGVDKGSAPASVPENNAEYLERGTWVVCARPGGLRVGSLAHSVKAKGGTFHNYDPAYIEEMYPDGEGMTWGYYDNNVTRTANNYCLSTVSASSKASTGGYIINVYLGNNGRLLVADTTLLMTKTLVPYMDGMSIDPNAKFTFQVFIDGFVGEYDAVVVRKNDATGEWQRQFHYIDLELDGKLFLQTTDSNKAMVDYEGCQVVRESAYKPDGASDKFVYAAECTSPTDVHHYAGDLYDPVARGEDGPYYVYVGRNEHSESEIGTTSTGMRVYHNNTMDGNGSVSTDDIVTEYYNSDGDIVDTPGDSEYSGIRKFYADKVWLVSEKTYNEQWLTQVDDEGNTIPNSGFDPVSEDSTDISGREELFDKCINYNEGGRFVLLTLDPSAVDTTEVKVITPYRTATAYWTYKAYFGYKGTADGSPSGAKLTAADLYDPIIPTADRPAFAEYTNDYIAQHTAEVTLQHGYGFLFNSIPMNANYRITEKLPEEGYKLKELVHVQQSGSASIYHSGIQKIPIYTRSGATYASPFEDYTTPNGLTWTKNQDGSLNTTGTTVTKEPFYHTNAVLWESYATLAAGALGNHHNPAAGETEAFYNGDTATEATQSVGVNPSCAAVDTTLADGSTIHHYYQNGELVDPHYENEWSLFLRNGNRYVVGPTVHFGVKGETQEQAASNLPAAANRDYTGVYSVFGNTGVFEEEAHFVNSHAPFPTGSVAVTKVTGRGALLPGAGFTMYEVDDAGSKTGVATPEVFTKYVYMEPLTADERDDEERYNIPLKMYTDLAGSLHPVHEEADGARYYFRTMSDDEIKAYQDGTYASAFSKDPARVRTVAEFMGLDVDKKYVLEETTLPDGYIITHQPGEIFSFEKGADDERVLHVLYEVKNFEPLELPSTGGTGGTVIAFGAMLSLIGISLAFFGFAGGKKGKAPPR